MKQAIYVVALASLLSGAHAGAPLRGCRHVEFSELKQMSTERLAKEWCTNTSRVNELQRDIKFTSISLSTSKELAKMGGVLSKERAVSAVEEDRRITDAQGELNKCSDELERITQILDGRKGGKAAKEAQFCP